MRYTVRVEYSGPFWQPGLIESQTRSLLGQQLAKVGLFLVAVIQQNTPVGVSGNLRSAWAMHQEQLQVTITNPMEYAAAVDLGRRPAFPPIEPLKLWVERKLGIAPENAFAVALAIARKKAREYTPGHNFVEKSFLSALPQMQQQLVVVTGVRLGEIAN